MKRYQQASGLLIILWPQEHLVVSNDFEFHLEAEEFGSVKHVSEK